MSSSEILAPRPLLLPFRSTLSTRSSAYPIAESRHVTDMVTIFTVCLCTANSGMEVLQFQPTAGKQICPGRQQWIVMINAGSKSWPLAFRPNLILDCGS
jgi:hypothetical protein